MLARECGKRSTRLVFLVIGHSFEDKLIASGKSFSWVASD
jgi:hypothetical protein